MAWFNPPLYKPGNKTCPSCGHHQGNYKFGQNRRKPWPCPECHSLLVYDRGRQVISWVLLVPFLLLMVMLFLYASVPVLVLGLVSSVVLSWMLGWWLESYRLKEASGDPSAVPQRTIPADGGTGSTLRRTAWIVWGFLYVPLVFFVVYAGVSGAEGAGTAGEDASLIKDVLYVMGAIFLGAALVLRWALRKWFRAKETRDLLVVILPGALCLSVGIYGWIVFLTSADLVSLSVLVGAAALSLVFMRPAAA